MRPYSTVVGLFEEAANEHVAVNTFAFGSLDGLNFAANNIEYPYVYLRPLTSPGLTANIRTLVFELYVLDQPNVDSDIPLNIMTAQEQTLYDLIAWFNRGSLQQEVGINLNSITPTIEAFNDRVYGWVANIDFFETGIYNYCNFPS